MGLIGSGCVCVVNVLWFCCVFVVFLLCACCVWCFVVLCFALESLYFLCGSYWQLVRFSCKCIVVLLCFCCVFAVCLLCVVFCGALFCARKFVFFVLVLLACGVFFRK